jgi:hypothetical protein
MADLSRQQVLEALQHDWGTYVDCFHALSPEEARVFLERQGYARFADLLSHIIAWWAVAFRTVENALLDPGFPAQEFDVDDFNTRAVESSRGLSEAQAIEAFEAQRQAFYELVFGLPEEAFRNPRVVDQLKMDVTGHYAGHRVH